eukprot:6039049-Prymnesium_polylepis.3
MIVRDGLSEEGVLAGESQKSMDPRSVGHIVACAASQGYETWKGWFSGQGISWHGISSSSLTTTCFESASHDMPGRRDKTRRGQSPSH